MSSNDKENVGIALALVVAAGASTAVSTGTLSFVGSYGLVRPSF